MVSFMKNFKIVNGQGAPFPIPWQVALKRNSFTSCGGTILDHSTILTARHCVDDYPVDKISILAGTTKKMADNGQV